MKSTKREFLISLSFVTALTDFKLYCFIFYGLKSLTALAVTVLALMLFDRIWKTFQFAYFYTYSIKRENQNGQITADYDKAIRNYSCELTVILLLI